MRYYFRPTDAFAPEELPPPVWAKKDEWNEDELFKPSKPHIAPKFKKALQDITNLVEGKDKTYMECTVFPAGDPTMVSYHLWTCS